MKKSVLTTVATAMGLMFSGAVMAEQSGGNSYLRSAGTGGVVKGGAGNCWKASGDKTIEEACGDVVERVAAPVQAPAPTAPVVVAPKVEAAVKIDTTVLFPFDSSVLTPASKAELKKWNEKYSLKKIRIVGHSDQIGANTYNKTLSEKRAKVVKDYLVSLGVSADAFVSIEGVGKSQPVVQCSPKTIKCEAENRRAEVSAEGLAK